MAGGGSRRGRGPRAFTLIEVIIACALVAVIAGAVLLAILAKIADAKIQRAISEVSTVETGVASWVYRTGNTTYSDITSINDLISAGAVPPSLGEPGANPWGGDYNVVGEPDTFAIVVTTLPSEAICQAVHRVFANRALISCTSNSPWQGRYTFGNVVIPPPGGGGGGGGGSTIALTVNTPSNGTVTASGISCPGDCSETYPAGSTVPLTAVPAENYDFAGWGGDCSGTGTCSLMMNGSKTISASFTLTQRTSTVESPSNGTVSGPGIGCPGDCVESYDHGTEVALTATPAENYVFAGWTGDCSGTGACTLTMGVNKSVGATFTLVQHSLTVTVGPSGTVSSEPAGMAACASNGGTCVATFDHGTSVTLTATPATSHVVDTWSGCSIVSGTNKTQCSTSMTSAKTVSVTFRFVQTVSDNFNRANSNNVNVGGEWSESETTASVLSINSNRLRMSTISGDHTGAILRTESFSANQFAQMMFISDSLNGNTSGLVVRGSGTVSNFSGYVLVYYSADGGKLQIRRASGDIRGGAGFWSLGGAAEANVLLAVGDVIRLEVNGNQLSAYRNGSLVIGPVTENNIASGKPGYTGRTHDTSRSQVWDDFVGGDFD